MKKRIVMVSLICILLLALTLPVLMAPDNPLPAVSPEMAVAQAEAVTPPSLAIVQQDEGILATLAAVDSTATALALSVASLVVLALFFINLRKRQTKSTATLQSRVWGFSAPSGIVQGG